MEGADVRGAVTERRHGHPTVALARRSPSQPVSDGQSRADDAGGEHEPDAGPRHVHGAALALPRALGPTEHLGQQEAERYALGDLVVQPPVRRHEVVVGHERRREPGRDGFLSRGASSRRG